ncbi:hypothetical protein [Thalassolituus oleivorans]|uniref:hypothetical protein n=1 Tax=Thalassolituus oleivorans TaxID=187493 RepID=UPI00042DCB4D|nr:hypothetical protein [Thalassolituus oleivorans]AHK17453.1 hypothetical protein R615_06500 [Thalassolituus oleivorans R6-15]
MTEEKNTVSGQKGSLSWVVKAAFMLTTIVAVWAPFSGYLYLKDFLERYGFQSVDIDINVYKLVFSLLASMADGVNNLLSVDALEPLYNEAVWLFVYAVAGGITVFLGVYLKHRYKLWLKTRSADIKPVCNAALSGVLTFVALVFTLPVVSLLFWWGSIAIIVMVWFMGVVGYIGGQSDAVESFKDGHCFDNKTPCIELLINRVSTPVEILYSDSSMAYVISAEGLIAVNPEGKAVYRLSMEGVKAKFAVKDEAPKGDTFLSGE